MNNLHKLKILLKQKKIDAYIVPKYDIFFSEEVLDADDRLKYISKFSGSSGWALIVSLNIKSVIISDGRYEKQVKKQVNQEEFNFINGGIEKIIEFVNSNRNIRNIAIDPKLISISQFNFLKKNLNKLNINFKLINKNQVDLVWKNKPIIPSHNLSFIAKKYVGETLKVKQKKIINYLNKNKCNGFFSFKPDAISWLLNIRDKQLKYSPVLRCFSLIHKNKNIYIFFEKLSKISFFEKNKNIKVYAFENLKDVLMDFKNQIFLVDPNSTPIFLITLIKKFKIKIFYKDCPISFLKSQKNSIEQTNLKNAHKADAIAFIKFWKWFENLYNINLQDEESLSRKLFEFRSENKLFKGNSFPTISAFGKNGSIIHYRYKKNKSSKITKSNLYLIDSGGQYLNGTTDVTRVLIQGLPTKDMKNKYTLVLKGYLALSNLIFPKGIRGKDIDSIARVFLWEHKLDYPHGTGHGVGFYLNVHEGPISISKSNSCEVKPGMVISNEPGYYGNKFGIRIENLELVKEDKNFLKFETLTLIPFEKKLIEKKLLTTKEIGLIDNYHRSVFNYINPLISNDKNLSKFLKVKTSKL